MATIVTIAAGDQITNSRADLNTNFSNLNADKIETSVLDTDTALAANSDSKIPSQKAVKAYVDAGGNVNASTTTKGIVEEATAAEVLAGTAAGSTSARLFINPAAPPMGAIKSVTAGATIAGGTLPVPVYQNKTDNEFYACDANDTAAYKFLGFAVSDGTNGNTFRVQFTGIVSGFSALDEGEKYYVQDAVGTIGTTPGTQEILVGIAISTTELLIQKGRRYASGILTLGTSVSDQTLTVGFRVSRLRITAIFADASFYDDLLISYVNGSRHTQTAHFADAANAGSTDGEGRLNSNSAVNNDFIAIGVGTITDTTFVITLAETGTFTGGARLLWEAEGDL